MKSPEVCFIACITYAVIGSVYSSLACNQSTFDQCNQQVSLSNISCSGANALEACLVAMDCQPTDGLYSSIQNVLTSINASTAALGCPTTFNETLYQPDLSTVAPDSLCNPMSFDRCSQLTDQMSLSTVTCSEALALMACLLEMNCQPYEDYYAPVQYIVTTLNASFAALKCTSTSLPTASSASCSAMALTTCSSAMPTLMDGIDNVLSAFSNDSALCSNVSSFLGCMAKFNCTPTTNDVSTYAQYQLLLTVSNGIQFLCNEKTVPALAEGTCSTMAVYTCVPLLLMSNTSAVIETVMNPASYSTMCKGASSFVDCMSKYNCSSTDDALFANYLHLATVSSWLHILCDDNSTSAIACDVMAANTCSSQLPAIINAISGSAFSSATYTTLCRNITSLLECVGNFTCSPTSGSYLSLSSVSSGLQFLCDYNSKNVMAAGSCSANASNTCSPLMPTMNVLLDSMSNTGANSTFCKKASSFVTCMSNFSCPSTDDATSYANYLQLATISGGFEFLCTDWSKAVMATGSCSANALVMCSSLLPNMSAILYNPWSIDSYSTLCSDVSALTSCMANFSSCLPANDEQSYSSYQNLATISGGLQFLCNKTTLPDLAASLCSSNVSRSCSSLMPSMNDLLDVSSSPADYSTLCTKVIPFVTCLSNASCSPTNNTLAYASYLQLRAVSDGLQLICNNVGQTVFSTGMCGAMAFSTCSPLMPAMAAVLENVWDSGKSSSMLCQNATAFVTCLTSFHCMPSDVDYSSYINLQAVSNKLQQLCSNNSNTALPTAVCSKLASRTCSPLIPNLGDVFVGNLLNVAASYSTLCRNLSYFVTCMSNFNCPSSDDPLSYAGYLQLLAVSNGVNFLCDRSETSDLTNRTQITVTTAVPTVNVTGLANVTQQTTPGSVASTSGYDQLTLLTAIYVGCAVIRKLRM